MGNNHSASHTSKTRKKNVHWKSAGRPAAPGKPDIIPILSDDEPNAVTLRWMPSAHDGGAPLHGYQVECNRLGSKDWIRTAPPVVLRPELVLTGLEPPHRYQFRVAALNAVGQSDYSEISDVLNVNSERASNEPPILVQQLEDVIALENDKTEFRVVFTGVPPPKIAWFKDDYEIFSSRRTAITTDETSSVLVFHQTLPSDEGEIKCTATNRGGHVVTKARLSLEAAPKLRYPRQYEDGLLYEINETIFLKTTIVGKPTPTVDWRHDGQPIVVDDRVMISNTPQFSVLKIHSARRSDRGEYQVHAKNRIGEDTASFLVTVTAPPDPPRYVSVTRQVDKSVTLDWVPPEDDGGCRIGNYVVEYYRTGWNVWLKATTSRKTNITLFDLIEGSEYKFRVKAESPYGMSLPSLESAVVRIPGRSVDMEFLAVEARIINDALTREDGDAPHVSPAPRRKRQKNIQPTLPEPPSTPRQVQHSTAGDDTNSNEFMLVLYPDNQKLLEKEDTRSKRLSLQLDMDSLSPPPISLSTPALSTRTIVPFKPLRNAVSSTQLLHERAMARFYKAVAMKEEQTKNKNKHITHIEQNKDIPYKTSHEQRDTIDEQQTPKICEEPLEHKIKTPEILIQSDSVEYKEYTLDSRQSSGDIKIPKSKWQQISFEEDYTASTVSSDDDDDVENGSLNGEIDRNQYSNEEDTYNPRGKAVHSSTLNEKEQEKETIKGEIYKPLPLPDPLFIPKPILKRGNILQGKSDAQSREQKPKAEEKLKKESKMTIFKNITKFPVQTPFSFPKILNKKEPDTVKNMKSEEMNKDIRKIEKTNDKINEEGRTVIEYYGNIVKEYGSKKKRATHIYLNTEDLKEVAEKQLDNSDVIDQNKMNIVKNFVPIKSDNEHVTPNSKKINPINNAIKIKKPRNVDKTDLEHKIATKNCRDNQNNVSKQFNQQVLLKKAERATIIIPIDYQELETKAKMNVRSAIDYTVDVCLLLLAFWVYFFKDERLAIPFLILIIYRQIQETLLQNIPEWYRRYTPYWLKKKAS